MKTLTLTQPWATLVATGAKRIETRSWSTSYRGPLAIHAAKGYPRDARDVATSARVRQVLAAHFGDSHFAADVFPVGRVLAVCRLMACVRTEILLLKAPYSADMTEQEQAFGNYDEGRFGWMLADIKPLPATEPAKGALGLWDWDDAAYWKKRAECVG